MPGWDGFRSRAGSPRYGAPVLVDNDVNIMALGEHWAHWRETEHLLFVKVGTGIGCGIVADGRIHRGAEGAAGDIGHIALADHEDVICRCGNLGCLEAVAGGRALARAGSRGRADAPTQPRRRAPRARGRRRARSRLVREAGRCLGEVLAECVNFFNPRVIVIGGDIAEAHEQLLAGIREVVSALAAAGDARPAHRRSAGSATAPA